MEITGSLQKWRAVWMEKDDLVLDALTGTTQINNLITNVEVTSRTEHMVYLQPESKRSISPNSYEC